jgi:hypothetical protein
MNDQKLSEKVLAFVCEHFNTTNEGDGYSTLTASDVARALGVDAKAVGGAVTALQVAGKIEIEEWNTGTRKVEYFIHLVASNN